MAVAYVGSDPPGSVHHSPGRHSTGPARLHRTDEVVVGASSRLHNDSRACEVRDPTRLLRLHRQCMSDRRPGHRSPPGWPDRDACSHSASPQAVPLSERRSQRLRRHAPCLTCRSSSSTSLHLNDRDLSEFAPPRLGWTPRKDTEGKKTSASFLQLRHAEPLRAGGLHLHPE